MFGLWGVIGSPWQVEEAACHRVDRLPAPQHLSPPQAPTGWGLTMAWAVFSWKGSKSSINPRLASEATK